MSDFVDYLIFAGVLSGIAATAALWRICELLAELRDVVGGLHDAAEKSMAAGGNVAALERRVYDRLTSVHTTRETARYQQHDSEHKRWEERLHTLEAALRLALLADDATPAPLEAAPPEQPPYPYWLTGPVAEVIHGITRQAGQGNLAQLRTLLARLPAPTADSEKAGVDWLSGGSAALIAGLMEAGASNLHAVIATERVFGALEPLWPVDAAKWRLRLCFPGMPFDPEWMELPLGEPPGSPHLTKCLSFGVELKSPHATTEFLKKSLVSTR